MSHDVLLPETADSKSSRVNYSELLKQLETATLFDLFRLSIAIDRLLVDPARIARAKQRIRIGDAIEYFDVAKNRCVPALVLRCNRTRAVVRNLDDETIWQIGYDSINSDEVETLIHGPSARGLGRNEVSVGDRVGFFDRHNRDRYGVVTRLNPKTVTVRCDSLEELGRTERWRVAYSILFHVLDGECQHGQVGMVQAISDRRSSPST